MRICHIVPSLERRHGGPSKSVRALANAQAGDPGATIELLSTAGAGQSVDRSDGDAATLRIFPRVFPRSLTRSPGLAGYLRQYPGDCFHHHSLWLLTLRYAREAAALRHRPLIISPRGMMSGWAWQHHRWRKLFTEVFVHPGAFAGAAGWHATSPEERDDIHALGFRQPVCVSPNGVTLPPDQELAEARARWHEQCPVVQSRPVALFYSRFHRKKRLRELIALWCAAPRGDWLLLIVGLPDEYTTAEITAWIKAAGAADNIKVFDGTGRPPPYAVASLFLLPSHSENFGLVIAEALAAGVPALVTDTTPWQGLADRDCGWCQPWENFGPALQAALTTPPAELSAKGRRGRDWVARDYSWERAAGLLGDFYRHLSDAQP